MYPTFTVNNSYGEFLGKVIHNNIHMANRHRANRTYPAWVETRNWAANNSAGMFTTSSATVQSDVVCCKSIGSKSIKTSPF